MGFLRAWQVLALCALLAAVQAEWHSDLPQAADPIHTKLSNREFRKLHAESGHKFAHGTQLLSALAEGKREFDVLEALTEESPEFKQWNLADFDDTKNRGFYQSRALYKLHEGYEYVVLDGDAAHSQPRRLSSTQMLDCSGSGRIKDKTFLVSLGAQGSQLVTAVKPAPESGSNCLQLETEDVHPWELFGSMNIQAFVDRPFHTQYNDADGVEKSAATESGRKLGNDDIPPDAPLKSCSTFPTDLFLETKWIRMGRAMGCAYAIGMAPGSVAANYNWNTKSAAQAVILGPVTW